MYKAQLLHSSMLSANPKIAHGFSLKGGRNASFHANDSDAHYQSIAHNFGGDWQFAWLKQVHGDEIHQVSGPGLAGEGDAMITAERGLALVIRTADCVPVIIVAEGSIAAVHAGWRGVANGIVGKTVARLSKPQRAVIGPCIGLHNYEVGEEVVQGITGQGVPENLFVDRTQVKPRVDLQAAVSWQLKQAGVEYVDILAHCTFADLRLHSYRRDKGASGRMAAVIGLR